MILVLPVAIKPHLKSYLANKCAIEPHLVLSHKNKYSSFLLNSLRSKSLMLTDAENRYKIGDKPDKIMVSIPEFYEKNFGITISIAHQYWFNKFLQEDFIDQMMFCIGPWVTGKKGEIKPRLLAFREKYDITEDDLPFKTLEKMWERNRHRLPSFRMN